VVSPAGLMPGFPYIQASLSPQRRPTEPCYQSPVVHKKKLRLREIRALARGTHTVSRGWDLSPCFCVLELVPLAATHRLLQDREAAGLCVLAGKDSGGGGFLFHAGPRLWSVPAGICLKIPRRPLPDPSSGSAHGVHLVGRCCLESRTSDQTLALLHCHLWEEAWASLSNVLSSSSKWGNALPDRPCRVARIKSDTGWESGQCPVGGQAPPMSVCSRCWASSAA